MGIARPPGPRERHRIVLTSSDKSGVAGERIEGPLLYLMLAGPASIGMSPQERGSLGYRLVVDGVKPLPAQQPSAETALRSAGEEPPDPIVGDYYQAETGLPHRTVDLEKLLAIEWRTVETQASEAHIVTEQRPLWPVHPGNLDETRNSEYRTVIRNIV